MLQQNPTMHLVDQRVPHSPLHILGLLRRPSPGRWRCVGRSQFHHSPRHGCRIELDTFTKTPRVLSPKTAFYCARTLVCSGMISTWSHTRFLRENIDCQSRLAAAAVPDPLSETTSDRPDLTAPSTPFISPMNSQTYPGQGLSISQLLFALNEELKRVSYSPS